MNLVTLWFSKMSVYMRAVMFSGFYFAVRNEWFYSVTRMMLIKRDSVTNDVAVGVRRFAHA